MSNRIHFHSFHFFFVFVISTAIVMGLFFAQLPNSVSIQAQTTIIGALVIFGAGLIINTVRVFTEDPLRFFR